MHRISKQFFKKFNIFPFAFSNSPKIDMCIYMTLAPLMWLIIFIDWTKSWPIIFYTLFLLLPYSIIRNYKLLKSVYCPSCHQSLSTVSGKKITFMLVHNRCCKCFEEIFINDILPDKCLYDASDLNSFHINLKSIILLFFTIFLAYCAYMLGLAPSASKSAIKSAIICSLIPPIAWLLVKVISHPDKCPNCNYPMMFNHPRKLKQFKNCSRCGIKIIK